MRQSAFGLLDSHTGWTGWEAAAHGPADAITIPDAHLLFAGDFKRAGTDLILSDETQRFVVHDYFRGEHHPTLLSPDGARLAADVVEALTGHGAYAQAAATPNAVVAVGRVAKVEGSATIVRNGVAITVNTGDAVLKGDVLQTGAGVLGITFADGSTLSLTANSRLMVDDFVYDSNGSANSEVLNLVQGSLSFISGEVAHTGGNMKITTPVATMGIRGTVGGITQASDGTVSFFVVESATGAVITDGAGHVIAQVVQNGPLIQVRATGPLDVVAAEIQKSPQELAAELAVLQQIVSTQAVGQQLIQHFQDLQNNQGPHSTGTDHTQIQIDIPKSAFTDAGTGGANTQSASNTATVTTTTTDQNGTTTTTTDQVPFQPDPTPPPSSGQTVFWTGAGSPDSSSSNNANWTPGAPTSADDVVIGRDQNDDPVPDQTVIASAAFTAHSLTLSDGAQLQASDVTASGIISLLGDSADGNDQAQTTEITAAGPDLSFHDLGGLVLVATVGNAEISAACDLMIGGIAGTFSVQGTADPFCAGFAEISAGHNLTIGNIVGDFLNQGLIDADYGTLSIGTVGGTFVNDGVMRAYELQIADGNAPLDNHGTIIATSLHNFGTIEATQGGSIYFGCGVLENCGTIEAHSGGTVDFNHWVGGNGTLAMDGGTVELASGTCNTIDFSGSCGGALALDDATASLGQIFGFGPGDSIDLSGLCPHDLSIVGFTPNNGDTGGTLDLYSSSLDQDITFSFLADGYSNYSVDNFVLVSDGHGGTELAEKPVLTLNDPEVSSQEDGGGTISGLAILDPFAGKLTITATTGNPDDGSLTLVDAGSLTDPQQELISDGSNGTLEAKATLGEINAALAHGVTYTPSECPPLSETISVTITDGHQTDEVDFVFNVAGSEVNLTGTGNKDYIYATGNNDTLNGAAGSDTFVFQPHQSGGGQDVINDFDTAKDHLFFDNSIFASAQDVLNHAHDCGANTVICEGNNNTITLTGIHVQDLQASHILISA